MKFHLMLVFLLAAISSAAQAEADVFVCIGDGGVKEYKNNGDTKGCRKVDMPGITVVPSIKRAAPPQQQATNSKVTPSPSDFPKIDSDTQKARDNDRRGILMDEMRNEEQKLNGLKKEFNNGEPERRGDERNYAKYQERVLSLKDDVTRAEKNIDALKRELSNLK